MEQVIPPEQFSTRLFALEQEIAALRREINLIHVQAEEPPRDSGKIRFADQQRITKAIDQLFGKLGIPLDPVSSKEVRELMRKANLEPNEMSRGIIEMRDE